MDYFSIVLILNAHGWPFLCFCHQSGCIISQGPISSYRPMHPDIMPFNTIRLLVLVMRMSTWRPISFLMPIILIVGVYPPDVLRWFSEPIIVVFLQGSLQQLSVRPIAASLADASNVVVVCDSKRAEPAIRYFTICGYPIGMYLPTFIFVCLPQFLLYVSSPNCRPYHSRKSELKAHHRLSHSQLFQKLIVIHGTRVELSVQHNELAIREACGLIEHQWKHTCHARCI